MFPLWVRGAGGSWGFYVVVGVSGCWTGYRWEGVGVGSGVCFGFLWWVVWWVLEGGFEVVLGVGGV